MNPELESLRETPIGERPLADASTRLSRAGAYPMAEGDSSRNEHPAWRSYYADAGPASGCVLLQGADRQIGVLNDPNDARRIGTALRIGHTAAGVALWKLCVENIWLTGRWIVVNRRFQAASRR
jgi:hypothetical protein